ncbi:MAG: ATP-binding protein [Chitinophagaceae bacterium]
MIQSVKNKIRLGTIFLFVLVVILGGSSLYYLNKIKNESRNVIKANYESIDYGHKMQLALDAFQMGQASALDSLAKYIGKQALNITEPGEKEITEKLVKDFEEFSKSRNPSIPVLSDDIQQILAINMNALKVKNARAEESAESALALQVMIVGVILIVGLTFAYNFPSVITDPINKITEGIQAISNKNYAHRIHVESKDEFASLADAYNVMAERLEYFENSNLNKLMFEKSRAEAVINSLKDASIGIDKDGQILFANAEALQLLNMTAPDLVGKQENDIRKRNDLFRHLMESSGQAPFKIVVDGKENFFMREMVEVAQEKSSSRVIVLKNITSFKELDVAKTNFIATVSHELKTPLAASDLSIKLLEDERINKLTADQQELVNTIKGNNQRMLKILSELLNMSQVETGKIKLALDQVDLKSVIENSIEAVLPVATQKQITIVNNGGHSLPTVEADKDKLIWVLNNFLSNAITYAPSGSTITVDAATTGEGIQVSVKDQGPGIEEKYQEKIFERYFQVPGRSDAKGSGIGLAISKEFISAMGGKVWVKSELGQGSTFGFTMNI